jgi:hypothetical protein
MLDFVPTNVENFQSWQHCQLVPLKNKHGMRLEKYRETRERERTTSGNSVKLLLFKFRYRRRDRRENATGRVVKRLWPRAIL